MPDRPFTPPTRKPVSEYPTPDPSVAFYTELVNRDDPAYYANAPVSRGSLYATMVGAKQSVIDQYPNLFFLRERKFQLNDQLVLWDWATDENAHDSYNAEVNYIANAVTFPAFTRTYTVRRELYESDPILQIGSPLPGIIAVEITNPGQNHTEARGVIPGTSVDIRFTVSPNGGLINGVITNTGEEIIQDRTPITIIGDGQDSTAIARAQPVGCVLTSQKKEELPEDSPLSHELVKVTRVYETLPGPWIYSTRIDKDNAIVTVKTRRQVADFITDDDILLNGEWTQTWHKGTDNFVAEETVETRPIPGNPIVTTNQDNPDDGMVVTTTKTLFDASLVVSGETLIAGIWTKTRKEEVASTTFVKDTSASTKVCWKVEESRPIPGNPIPDTEVEEDGKSLDIARTRKDKTLIVTSETLSGGVWVRTDSEPISDLVSWEVVRARVVPGAFIQSASVDADHEVVGVYRVIKDTTQIVPSAAEGGGFITTVEKKELTDLVSNEVVSHYKWLDKAFYSVSIENLIPREFMAFIPTTVESHVKSITGDPPVIPPVLGVGELEHSVRILTELLYEERVTILGTPILPITHTNQETTEEYGGGILDVVYTLNLVGTETIDADYWTVHSSVINLGNGMEVKESRTLAGAPLTEWPVLLDKLWDENMRELYLQSTQVVPKGTDVSPDPGIYFAFLSEIRKLDDWRSIRINIGKDTPAYVDEATALITYKAEPFRFPGLLYRAAAGYYVRSTDARIVQHKVKTWWEKSVTPPVVSFIQIVMDNPIISTLNNVSTLDYAGFVLHDDLLTFNTFFYPATTPSFSEYTGQLPVTGVGTIGFTAGSNVATGTGTAFLTDLQIGDVYGYYGSGGFTVQSITSDTSLIMDIVFPFTISGFPVVFNRPSAGWVGTERVVAATVTPEKEPNIWKVQTESVVMR